MKYIIGALSYSKCNIGPGWKIISSQKLYSANENQSIQQHLRNTFLMNVLNIFQRFLVIVLIMDIDYLLISSINPEFTIINQTVTSDCLQCDGLQSGSNRILVGSNVNLSCQSSSAYRYCIWEHTDKECRFEWTRVWQIPVNSIIYY